MTRNKIFNFCIAVLMVAIVSSCGGGGGDDTPDLTPEEQRILDLAGSTGTTWVATSVTFEDAPAVGFDNFSITLRGSATSQTYTSNSGDPVFRASGSWAFNNNNISQLIFDSNNNNIFQISNLNTASTPATVVLTVNFTSSGGVAFGTDGVYVFNLQAQ